MLVFGVMWVMCGFRSTLWCLVFGVRFLVVGVSPLPLSPYIYHCAHHYPLSSSTHIHYSLPHVISDAKKAGLEAKATKFQEGREKLSDD